MQGLSLQNLLQNEYQLEFSADVYDKLQEFTARITAELLETADVIRTNQQRALRKEDVRWIMDDLRTRDQEAIILRRLENHSVKDFPFEEAESIKEKEVYKAFVPMKNQQNLRRNAQLATKEEYNPSKLAELKKKNSSFPKLKTEQSTVNQGATIYQQIFQEKEEDEEKKPKINLPFFK